jgi:hypothetical protein
MRPSDRKLRDALIEAGVEDLAQRAADFNDFFGAYLTPKMELVTALRPRAADSGAVAGLIKRVMAGEFDSDREESQEWARSPEGQAVRRQLR